MKVLAKIHSKALSPSQRVMVLLSICFGFLLSHCQLLGLTLPFGLSLVCGVPRYLLFPSGFGCLLGLLWADLQTSRTYYLCFLGFCVLLRWLLGRFRFGKTGWCGLLCGAASAGLAFGVQLVWEEGNGVLIFLQLCELILILSFGYFCRCASQLGWQDGRLVWSDKRQLIGGIFLLVLLFLSTLSFSIYQIQPGMVLAISLLLAVMIQFGVQGASVYGVTLTLACCCYSADLLEGCLILACSAFLGSLFQSAGKAVQLMVFFLTSLFLALMISVNQAMLVLLGEELLGIGFYLVLPKRWLKAFAFPIQEKQPVSAGEQAALLRIQSCGEALQRQGKRLYQWQKKRPAQPEKPYSNTRQEIRREICATCPRVLHCRCQPGEPQIQKMEQYLLHTKSNHPDRSQINRLSPCGRVDAILSLVQRQMEQRVQRQQFNRQKRRLLRLAAEQMDALGGAMKELSQDLQHQGRELPQLEKQTAALLAELDLEANWICCRWEEEKRLILELALPNAELPSIAKLTRHLSLGLEQPLQAAEPVEVCDQKLLRFFSPPPLELEVGCCQMEKETGQPCGDTFFAFQDGYGLWYLFLADGMGTGTLAAQDSQALAGLAQELLASGLHPSAVLRFCSNCLEYSLSAESCCAVDLLCLNLYESTADLYKLGGASSALLNGKEVQFWDNHQLPLGVLEQRHYECQTMNFSSNSRIYLWSDGMNLPQKVLESLLVQLDSLSPKAAAKRLAELAVQFHGKGEEDDITVVVLQIHPVSAQPEETSL